MMNNNHPRKEKLTRDSAGKAFTLIEMLVVIAIISLLVSILLPSLKSAKDLAQSVKCLANQRSSGTALMMYSHDYDDYALSPDGFKGDGFTTRYARYWPDTLMLQDYIADYSVEDGKDSTNYHVSAVDENNPFSFPSLEPPAFHTVAIWPFPRAGTAASSKLSYGLRGLNWYRFDGERYNDEFIPRMSSLDIKYPYMGDTVSLRDDGALEQSGWLCLSKHSWSSAYINMGSLHRRHQDKANFWFPDGSARSVGKSEIETYPNSSRFGDYAESFGETVSAP